MAKIDPPWRLDPLRNIVNVGWAGGKYATIFYGVEYNFGTPSGINATGIPGYGSYGYNFSPFEFEVLRDGVNDKPPLDPITPKLVSSIQSAGRGNVTQFTTADGNSTSAGATLLIPLRDQDFTITLTLPGNLPSQPGEPTTLYDGFWEITVSYSDGNHGSGNGAFSDATLEQVQQIQAGLNGSSSIASWTGSLTITNTHEEPGTPKKHMMTHGYSVNAKKFKGKNPDGTPKVEDITVEGRANYSKTGRSEDNPVGDESFTVKYVASSGKISVS
jgi:hypothetical protein